MRFWYKIKRKEVDIPKLGGHVINTVSSLGHLQLLKWLAANYVAVNKEIKK